MICKNHPRQQEWLGHPDIQMTANIYPHLDNARKNTIAARMMQNVGQVVDGW